MTPGSAYVLAATASELAEVSLPSDALAAVIVMDNRSTGLREALSRWQVFGKAWHGAVSRRMNLVFSSPMERDEFVTCMLAALAP